MKKIRIAMKLNQSNMARLMGVTLRAYQRYENNEQKPSVDKIIKLLKELKVVSPEWLLLDKEPMFVENFSSRNLHLEAKKKIKLFIDDFFEYASEKELYWFEIQFEKTFPEFREWVKKQDKHE